MKFTKQNIEKLNKQAIEANDGLVESVTNYILDKFDEYDDPKTIVTELLEHGCVSGLVGELIYYSDTTAYYAKNKDAINHLLYELMDECGEHDLAKLLDKKTTLGYRRYGQNNYFLGEILIWNSRNRTLKNSTNRQSKQTTV